MYRMIQKSAGIQRFVWSAGLFVLLLAGSARAQEGEEKGTQPPSESFASQEIVVTAARLATPREEVGSSIDTLTDEQIDNRQVRPLEDALRVLPGVDVARTGGVGQASSVRLRGAEPRHTLVLMDGVELADPSSATRTTNFAHLSTEDIEVVEVLRGPQSTLYGSDAMGGVVNIRTKRGRVGKPKVHARLEGGSFDTVNGTLSVNGGNELIQFHAGFVATKTNGISTADEDLEGNEEDDWYENRTVFGRVTLTPAEWFDLDLSGRYVHGELEYDNGGGPNQDDPHSIQQNDQGYGRAEAHVRLFEDRWEQTLRASVTKYRREFDDPWNGLGDWPFEDIYWGTLEKFGWQNDIHLHPTNTLTLGVETEEEDYELDSDDDSPYDARTTGLFAQDRIALFDRWFTTVGVRRDRHDAFGAEVTWRVTSAFLVKETGTKLKGSYGTGFNAPSLYQLYAPPIWGPPVGNEDLQPEESRGWDLGLEQSLFDDRLKLGATYFRNRFSDMIDFVAGQGYLNRTEPTYTRGIEAFLEAEPIEKLSLRLDYTYMRTHDEETGEILYRRPEHKLGATVNYRFLDDRANVNLGVLYVGARDDQYWDALAFQNVRVRLEDYVVARLAVSYRFTDAFRMHGRVENMFDEDYEEAKGYGVPGAAGYVGFTLDF